MKEKCMRGDRMFKLECLTKVHREQSMGLCYPDYGLDCRPDGECSPDDGSDDCSPYEPD